MLLNDLILVRTDEEELVIKGVDEALLIIPRFLAAIRKLLVVT